MMAKHKRTADSVVVRFDPAPYTDMWAWREKLNANSVDAGAIDAVIAKHEALRETARQAIDLLTAEREELAAQAAAIETRRGETGHALRTTGEAISTLNDILARLQRRRESLTARGDYPPPSAAEPIGHEAETDAGSQPGDTQSDAEATGNDDAHAENDAGSLGSALAGG